MLSYTRLCILTVFLGHITVPVIGHANLRMVSIYHLTSTLTGAKCCDCPQALTNLESSSGTCCYVFSLLGLSSISASGRGYEAPERWFVKPKTKKGKHDVLNVPICILNNNYTSQSALPSPWARKNENAKIEKWLKYKKATTKDQRCVCITPASNPEYSCKKGLHWLKNGITSI